MAALIDQLHQLHEDLQVLVSHDPEQEVQGRALPLIDAVVAEARRGLPEDSTLGTQVVELISPDTIEAGEPLRAADALVVVGQLMAVLGHYEPRSSSPRERLDGSTDRGPRVPRR